MTTWDKVFVDSGIVMVISGAVWFAMFVAQIISTPPPQPWPLDLPTSGSTQTASVMPGPTNQIQTIQVLLMGGDTITAVLMPDGRWVEFIRESATEGK